MAHTSSKIQIRRAEEKDAARIADLCCQLGYPTTADEASRRFAALQEDAHHALYVAVSAPDGVIGLIHVCVHRLLIAERQAEIESLVVDEGYRHRGVGRLLLAAAERWARQQDCRAMMVRSNVVRQGVREFYEECGYRVLKAQWALLKNLPTYAD